MESVGVGSLKAWSHAYRNAAGWKRFAINREIPKRVVGKHARRRTNGCTHSVGELLRRKTGGGLNIIHVQDRVCRNRGMTRRDDTIQVVDSVERLVGSVWKFCSTREAHRGGLCIH